MSAFAEYESFDALGLADLVRRDEVTAEELLEAAIATATTINNTWYRVYYQVLFEQRKYAKAEIVIYGLVTRDPNNEDYWRMLTNHYLQIEDSKNALASMAIADLQGLLDEPKDRERLASMYGFLEIPEKAARILEAAVASELVDQNNQCEAAMRLVCPVIELAFRGQFDVVREFLFDFVIENRVLAEPDVHASIDLRR